MSPNYDRLKKKELEALCNKRQIPSKAGDKMALLYIIESHDVIQGVK